MFLTMEKIMLMLPATGQSRGGFAQQVHAAVESFTVQYAEQADFVSYFQKQWGKKTGRNADKTLHQAHCNSTAMREQQRWCKFEQTPRGARSMQVQTHHVHVRQVMTQLITSQGITYLSENPPNRAAREDHKCTPIILSLTRPISTTPWRPIPRVYQRSQEEEAWSKGGS
ncbi:hypothetical protein ABBQ38_008683 [Trebouxia sp. C0009 RCD-2024]